MPCVCIIYTVYTYIHTSISDCGIDVDTIHVICPLYGCVLYTSVLQLYYTSLYIDVYGILSRETHSYNVRLYLIYIY